MTGRQALLNKIVESLVQVLFRSVACFPCECPHIPAYTHWYEKHRRFRGGHVDINAPRSGWDVFLFGIPLIALLFFGFFRLDEVFTARKDAKQDRHPASPRERKGRSMHSDPDGRSWDEPDSPGK